MSKINKSIINAEEIFKKEILKSFLKSEAIIKAINITTSKTRASIESDFDTIFITKNKLNKQDIKEMNELFSFYFSKYPKLFAHKIYILPKKLYDKLQNTEVCLYFGKKSQEINHKNKEKIAFQYYLNSFEWSIQSYLQLITYNKKGISYNKNKLYKSITFSILNLKNWNKRKSLQTNFYGSKEYIHISRDIIAKTKNIVTKKDLKILKNEIILAANQINELLDFEKEKSYLLTSKWHGSFLFVNDIIYNKNIFRNRSKCFNSSVISYYNNFYNKINKTNKNDFYHKQYRYRKNFYTLWIEYLKDNKLTKYSDIRQLKFHRDKWKSVAL